MAEPCPVVRTLGERFASGLPDDHRIGTRLRSRCRRRRVSDPESRRVHHCHCRIRHRRRHRRSYRRYRQRPRFADHRRPRRTNRKGRFADRCHQSLHCWRYRPDHLARRHRAARWRGSVITISTVTIRSRPRRHRTHDRALGRSGSPRSRRPNI